MWLCFLWGACTPQYAVHQQRSWYRSILTGIWSRLKKNVYVFLQRDGLPVPRLDLWGTPIEKEAPCPTPGTIARIQSSCMRLHVGLGKGRVVSNARNGSRFSAILVLADSGHRVYCFMCESKRFN